MQELEARADEPLAGLDEEDLEMMIDRACEILAAPGAGVRRFGGQAGYRCWFEEREAAESPLDEEDDGIDGLDLG